MGRVGNFRDGNLHITIPVQAVTMEELEERAQTAKSFAPDLIEWRADAFCEIADPESLRKALTLLRGIMADTPILFTCRERCDNGQGDFSLEVKRNAIRSAVCSGLIDLVDIELAHKSEVPELLALSHAHDVLLIVSHHDWEKTPDRDEMERIAREEYDLGADIIKYSFFANTYGDIASIAEMTLSARAAWLDRPVFSIAGGEKGMASRICGRALGTDLTFASIGNTPQIHISDLRRLDSLIFR